ncbi:MAG: VIT1/CCC1 transporter family protein [Candidatus Bathyarchaeia archaeon]
MTMEETLRKALIASQRNEITEHLVYERLSKSSKDPHNREILKRISEDEMRHYLAWREYTREDVKPDRLRVWAYYLVSKIFGITFGLKLMELGEERAESIYGRLSDSLPIAKDISEEEDRHEAELLGLIDEERLRYVGSMVLGLNDALVELTGAIAGLTFALRDARLVAIVGLITGIAASLSMASSEYLSTKSEGGDRSPLKASLYTGIAYILTVSLLISPFLVFGDPYLCLGLAILNSILAILVFTFYTSIAKGLPFKRRFFEMVSISLGVAGLSFAVGILVRALLNVEI